jgi:hypothetical protein
LEEMQQQNQRRTAWACFSWSGFKGSNAGSCRVQGSSGKALPSVCSQVGRHAAPLTVIVAACHSIKQPVCLQSTGWY